MTREETVKIIRIMCDGYPNYKPNNLSETVDVWCMMLEEYTYEQISAALKAYILSDKSGFAPSIGQLVGKIHSISQPQELNEMEAWALVYRALGNSTYHSVEEFARLPPLVQKAVGLPDNLREWAMTENFNADVAGSNFMRVYRQVVERETDIKKYPHEIRMCIEMASQGSQTACIEEKRQQVIKSLLREEKPRILPLEGSEEVREIPDNVKTNIAKVKQDLNKN